MKTDYACKLSDVAKLYRKCESETGVKPKNVNLAHHSQSLLNVPLICVGEDDSNKSTSQSFASGSRFDDSEETVSMIVRNVEAWETDRRRESQDSELLEEIPLAQPEPRGQKVEASKKRDFIHSIQEKLHLGLHKNASPPKEHIKMFHDLKENVSGKFHQIAGKFHLPHTHQHENQQGTLVTQAMQTILMDKFNIIEASTPKTSGETTIRRKSSSSSLQSIKQKFNVFHRPRRSADMQGDESSLNSISEVHSTLQSPEKLPLDNLSLLELNISEDIETSTSTESVVTVIEKKSVSPRDSRASVDNFDSNLATHINSSNNADTNTKPLHGSLLSLSRNELSNSPGSKIHARTESIGSKFPASPAKNVSSSLGKDQITTGIHRRSSDSDLSVTPKGEQTPFTNYSFRRTTFIRP